MSTPTSNHTHDQSRRSIVRPTIVGPSHVDLSIVRPRRRTGGRSARGALRRTLRGFTLIELMAVVVIVGILATIAVPGAANRFRENRSQQAANEIATLYRNARMRAMGRGSAVLVRWQQATETFEVLEAIQGQAAFNAANAASCATQPASQCRNPLTRWQPGDPTTQLFQSLGAFTADSLGDHTTTVSVAGSTMSALDICFSPMGTAYMAPQNVTTNAALLQPMGDIPIVQVRRDSAIGLTRRVLFLPNGTARVVAEDPS